MPLTAVAAQVIKTSTLTAKKQQTKCLLILHKATKADNFTNFMNEFAKVMQKRKPPACKKCKML